MKTKEENEDVLTKDDIFRVVLIVVVAVIAIIGTWFKVANKYKNLKTDTFTNYIAIEGNSSYAYEIVDNKINFYNVNSDLVATYDCKTSCNVAIQTEGDYKYIKDNLITISDENKYIIYDLETKSIYHTFDAKPQLLNGSLYATVIKNNKYGLINNTCGFELDTEYDLIIYIDDYYVTVKGININILDKELNKLNDEYLTIESDSKIEVTSSNNMIFINVTNVDQSKYRYEFNVISKKYKKNNKEE